MTANGGGVQSKMDVWVTLVSIFHGLRMAAQVVAGWRAVIFSDLNEFFISQLSRHLRFDNFFRWGPCEPGDLLIFDDCIFQLFTKLKNVSAGSTEKKYSKLVCFALNWAGTHPKSGIKSPKILSLIHI